jgi:hypothetical protein
MHALRSTTVATFLFCMLALALLAPASGSDDQPSATWTVIAYMADDYYITLSWQDDLNEMEAAQQAPGTNIVALVDPLGPNNSMILKISHDPNFLDPTIVSHAIDDSGAVISNGEVDMGSPATLSALIEFAARSFPAEHYVLDLWGHGAGWRGLCPDGTDILTLPELRTALSDATSAIGKRLDMVVVDSCAEASVEMLCEIDGYADFFVASEKDVPYEGLPYALVLNDLASSPAQGVERYASRIVDDYVTWSVTNSEYSTTMAAFNLTSGQSLCTLSSSLEYYDPIFHDKFSSVLEFSEHYENVSTIDYGDMLALLSKSDIPLSIRKGAIDELMSLSRLIAHFAKYSNPDATDGIDVENATGMTIYVPSANPYDDTYDMLRIIDTGWDMTGRILSGATATIPNGPMPLIVYENALIGGAALPNAANITMPVTYGVLDLVVFRYSSWGFAENQSHISEGQQAAISGIAGKLAVDVSTHSQSEPRTATSYHRLNITLYGESKLEVEVFRGGEHLLENNYEVSLDGPTGNNTASFSKGSYTANLTIPYDAEVGDKVTIIVRDRGSGEILTTMTTVIAPSSMTAYIEIRDHRSNVAEEIVLASMSILPGVLVFIFATMLHRQQKGRRE